MQRQQRTEWCWAAVSVSVNAFFRPDATHSQCRIAGSALRLKCCSRQDQPSRVANCNVPHTLHTVLGRLHLLAAVPILEPLSFLRVKREIDANRPICVLIKWLATDGTVGDRGHFIAIDGYRITPRRTRYLLISDPMFGPSEMEYTEFSRRSGGYRDGSGVWFASFLVANMVAS